MPTNTETRSERIDVRATPSMKRLLHEAAQTANKSVSEFLLESALTAAAEALADRRLFVLDKDQWNAFVAALDAPPQPRPRLERLLREPGVFDSANLLLASRYRNCGPTFNVESFDCGKDDQPLYYADALANQQAGARKPTWGCQDEQVIGL